MSWTTLNIDSDLDYEWLKRRIACSDHGSCRNLSLYLHSFPSFATREQQTQFYSKLQEFLRQEPNLEGILIKGIGQTKRLPLKVISTIFAHAKRLEAIAFDDINVTCDKGNLLTLEDGLFRALLLNTKQSSNQKQTGFCSLVSDWVQEHGRMEQLRIEESDGPAMTSISLLGNEDYVYGVCLRVPQPNITFILESLSHSPPHGLVKLTLRMKRITLSDAMAVAAFLRNQPLQGPTLQELCLEGVDRLANEEDSLQGDDEIESALLLEVSSLIASALRRNKRLRSFRLSGRQRAIPYQNQDQCLQLFADMMEHNTRLESFQFLWVTHNTGKDLASQKLQMFLKLNRNGQRRQLLQAEDYTCWVHAIEKHNSGWSCDPSCVYYLLRANPSLCCV